MATTEKSRNLGIDILCCLGVMLLLGLSFFNAIGVTEIPVNSYMAALPIAARWFCLSGAMLLACCTGYVLSSRKLSVSYFKIFGRLIYIYAICSVCTIALRYFVLREEMTLLGMVQSLFDFTASETGKFAGMYFGLLLAAPFVNAAFHDLKSRRARMAFLAITALVSTLQPTLQYAGIYLIPAWCKGLFPLAAYIGGAYIRRYSRRKDIFSLIVFLIALCVAQTVVVLSISMSNGMIYCPWLDSMASLPCLCIAMSLVGIFRSKREGIGSGHRFFGGAAGGALAALLLGAPLLQCLMPALEERFYDLSSRLYAGFAVVPVLFIVCAALGLILQAPFLLIRQAAHGRGAESEAAEESEESEEVEEIAEPAAPEMPAEEPEEEPEEIVPEETAEEVPDVLPESAAYEETDADDEEYEEYEDDDEYEEYEEDEEDETDEELSAVQSAPVAMPGRTSQPVHYASETSSRHTISVPVSQPEMPIRLTQPPAEKPIGVYETELPKRQPTPPAAPPAPKSYTLDDILSEQGIPVKHMPKSVDDLIAELTK